MLKFENSFFDGEERDGFYIEPMMKCAWAAQLEVLNKIDAICKEHDITYFADWGTLLGAVRHHGFIPWDDDVDIGMLRPDYLKFLEIMECNPEGLVCFSVFNDSTFGGHPAKVLNNTKFTVERRTIKENYGFPFMAGVDVFPIDYIPRDEALKQEQLDVLRLILKARHLKIEMEDYSSVSQEYIYGMKLLSECLEDLQRMCNITFSQENPTDQELMILYEEVAGLYGEDNADYVAAIHRLVYGQEYLIPKEYYMKVVNAPFENIEIPIPVGYDWILRKKYGDEYMTPVNRGGGHDYPFYNTLISALAKTRGDAFEKTQKYVTDISTEYYKKFLHKSSSPSILYESGYFAQEEKRTCAALIENLLEVKRICEKNDIKFFAIENTLQDAVELQNVNLLSEELHLGMLRDDYVRFLNVFQAELDPWFDYSSIYTNDSHKDLRCVIFPDGYLCNQEDYLSRFHGCSRPIKIYISVLDAVDPDENLDSIRKKMVEGLLTTARNVGTAPPYSKMEMGIAREWMEVTQSQIDLEGNLSLELLKLADRVGGAFRNPSELVRLTTDLQEGKDTITKKVWYDDVIELPFGKTTIPVPIGYKEILG